MEAYPTGYDCSPQSLAVLAPPLWLPPFCLLPCTESHQHSHETQAPLIDHHAMHAHLQSILVRPSSTQNSTAVKSPTTKGDFQLVVNSATGKSSTGALGVHAILLPGTNKVLMFDRGTWGGFEPNMTVARCSAGPNSQISAYDRGSGRDTFMPADQSTQYERCGVISSVFDIDKGTYEPMPFWDQPFCAGQTFLANGTAIIAGGERAGEGQMPW